jgi:hypothetical protein
VDLLGKELGHVEREIAETDMVKMNLLTAIFTPGRNLLAKERCRALTDGSFSYMGAIGEPFELELVIEQQIVAVFKFLPRDPDCVVLHFSAKRRPPV